MKRKTQKPILRRLEFSIAGRTIKTHKQKITLRHATRECPEEHSPFTHLGAVHRFTRKAGIVTVAFTYEVVEELIQPIIDRQLMSINPADSVLVARHGGLV